MKKSNHIKTLFFATASAIFTLLSYGKSVEVFDAGNTGNIGIIEISCEQGTMIFLDENFILTSEAENGVIIQNIDAGAHKIKTKIIGFAPQEFTLFLKHGKVESIQARASSPIANSNRSKQKLSDALDYSNSKLSTIELNKIRAEMKKQNIKHGSEYYGFDSWRYGKDVRIYVNNLRIPNYGHRSIDGSGVKYFSEEILGEDGETILVEVFSKFNGYMNLKAVDKAIGIPKVEDYIVNIGITFFITFNGEIVKQWNDQFFHQESPRTKYRDAEYKTGAAIINDLKSTQDVEIEYYPIIIKCNRSSSRTVRYTHQALQDWSYLHVSTEPSSKYTK